MKRALYALLSVMALTSTAPAQSPDLSRAKASFEAGASAYAAGDYLAAIQALDAAYEISPLPAIAFSLAQAERKQYFRDGVRAHLERAVALFRRYLEQEPVGSRREDASVALSQLEPLLRTTPEQVQPAAPPHARPTRLMIVSDAPAARISLDNEIPAPSPVIREVTPGEHRAYVQAPGYYDDTRVVTAIGGELLLTDVRLNERPAMLYVAAPVGADIYVDGIFLGQGGKRRSVSLRAGHHQLSVGMKGHQPVRRELELKRGATHSEQVDLASTTQRKVSNVMFITGGAAVGVGMVFTALAVRSQNRAEDYLATASRGNVGRAQLTSYNALITDRDRYRVAATVSIASAVGLFVTGLFLHELDHPDLPTAASPDLPSTTPVRSSSASRWTFTPEVAGSELGGSLHLSF